MQIAYHPGVRPRRKMAGGAGKSRYAASRARLSGRWALTLRSSPLRPSRSGISPPPLFILPNLVLLTMPSPRKPGKARQRIDNSSNIRTTKRPYFPRIGEPNHKTLFLHDIFLEYFGTKVESKAPSYFKNHPASKIVIIKNIPEEVPCL